MLRKDGNISSATSSLTNLPLTPFSSAFQSFLSQSFTLTQQASGVWSAVRMRATGWPDNFADTWELQMLPRASSLLNVSVEAVRRRARFFSSSLSFSSLLVYLLFSCPVSFSPRPSRLLLSTLSFFLSFFSPLEASPRNVEVGNSGWAMRFREVGRSWKGRSGLFLSIHSKNSKANFSPYFRPMFEYWQISQ